MPKRKLTDAGVRNLTTGKTQEDFWDQLTPGLCVRVSGATGRKTWYVRYRANGKHRRMKLGTYPGVSLADARTRARDVQADADAGKDPVHERRNGRQEDGETTFRALADEVLRAKAPDTREATQTERRRILDTDLLPRWGEMEAGELTRRDVILLRDAIVKRAGAPMANRTVALLRLIYNEGLIREFPGLEYNPAHKIKPKDEGRRRRYLTRKEIKTVWKGIEKETPVMGSIFKLALLTGQRIGSVCAMRWEDIGDDDVWTIPADQFKGKRRHCVPLSDEALAVLETMRPISAHLEAGVVFPGRGDGKEPHVSGHNSALRRIRERTKIPHWTAHDFRTTFRTHATRPVDPKDERDPAGLGVEPHIADAVLGHKEASLGFDRYQAEPERYLLGEKRDALKAWGAFVASAVADANEGG